MHYSVQETEKYISEVLVKKALDMEEKEDHQIKVITEKRTKQSILKDIKMFVGNIRELITEVKRGGVDLRAAQFDRGEYFEFVIRIPKKENGLMK